MWRRITILLRYFYYRLLRSSLYGIFSVFHVGVKGTKLLPLDSTYSLKESILTFKILNNFSLIPQRICRFYQFHWRCQAQHIVRKVVLLLFSCFHNLKSLSVRGTPICFLSNIYFPLWSQWIVMCEGNQMDIFISVLFPHLPFLFYILLISIKIKSYFTTGTLI